MADGFPTPPASWAWSPGLLRGGSWCSLGLTYLSERWGSVPGPPCPASSLEVQAEGAWNGTRPSSGAGTLKAQTCWEGLQPSFPPFGLPSPPYLEPLTPAPSAWNSSTRQLPLPCPCGLGRRGSAGKGFLTSQSWRGFAGRGLNWSRTLSHPQTQRTNPLVP